MSASVPTFALMSAHVHIHTIAGKKGPVCNFFYRHSWLQTLCETHAYCVIFMYATNCDTQAPVILMCFLSPPDWTQLNPSQTEQKWLQINICFSKELFLCVLFQLHTAEGQLQVFLCSVKCPEHKDFIVYPIIVYPVSPAPLLFKHIETGLFTDANTSKLKSKHFLAYPH